MTVGRFGMTVGELALRSERQSGEPIIVQLTEPELLPCLGGKPRAWGYVVYYPGAEIDSCTP